MLWDIHDNVVAILDSYAIPLLILLARYDKIQTLRDDALAPMQRREYASALDGLRNFVLEDPVMFKLFPELVDHAEPGLVALETWADEYGLHA